MTGEVEFEITFDRKSWNLDPTSVVAKYSISRLLTCLLRRTGKSMAQIEGPLEKPRVFLELSLSHLFLPDWKFFPFSHSSSVGLILPLHCK